ncbi:hypothetical protein T01_8507 [Trichinella spiralis]|uniref:Uncharacterized protein n=1 Tax=Trichinella spiralis TaxID=6334 RepID=A0A0V0YYM8_TRISP|nr:hypothetical protein T01_8507 [Trichinella spiralis]
MIEMNLPAVVVAGGIECVEGVAWTQLVLLLVFIVQLDSWLNSIQLRSLLL